MSKTKKRNYEVLVKGYSTMEQTAEKPGRWARVKAFFGGKR